MDSPKKLKEELGGETITLKTRNNALFLEKTKESGIAKSAVIAGEEVKLTVDNAHTLLPRVINLAAENKVFVESISVQEPQLDDVFLHFTGRALREGGKELSGMGMMMRRKYK
jgi:ABC-2 type transport system ATP-binding protein